MATLTGGSSVTIGMDAWATLSLVVRGSATLEFTSAAPNVHPSFSVTKATSRNFGPFGCPMSVVITAADRDLTYTITGGVGGFAYDDYGNAKGQVGPGGYQVTHIDPYAFDRKIDASLAQPGAITRPVTAYGKLACRFGSGQWTATSGSPTLTQGYTGWDGSGAKTGVTSRTGMPDMLKVVPAANTAEQITLGSFSTNMLTKGLAGKFGLWVYLEAQPGYDNTVTPTGSINVEMSTSASLTNGFVFGFNTNQLREGWNFLKFVMRDPLAYQTGTGVTEYHPFGVTATAYGTGADSNIVASDVARIAISWANLSGATLYFDSIWTAFSSQAQIVWGNDAGVGLLEYAVPIMDAYGWVGYTAFPYASGGTHAVIADLNSNVSTTGLALYNKGWDFINHTANHPNLGTLTSEAQMVYEMETARAWQYALGFRRGAQFYASPQSGSSRLSEGVISGLGFKLQRHSRKWNVSVTPWGVDNPQHFGGIDMGHVSATGVSRVVAGSSSSIAGFQTATKIKRAIDVVVAYGDTLFPFWHGVTTTGDTGSGDDLTGDNLLLTVSAITAVFSYARTLEQAGSLRVCRGMTGFYYGER